MIPLKNRLKVILLLLASFLILKVDAQQHNNEQIKRLQRSIYIFNFAQQVGGWPEFEQLENFKIGVLGPDRTSIDLKSLAQKRSIQTKPVQVVRFNLIKEVRDVQVLFVNNKYNYDIAYILRKIEGKNILLVTEDYNYHSSMINMINVKNSFEYEINSELLEQANFIVTPSLKKYAVSTSQKWKDLYMTIEASLNNAKEKEIQQRQVLANKEQQIRSQKETIKNQEITIDTTLKEVNERDNWIEQLNVENSLQQKRYDEKILIEEELEKNIQQQIAFIKTQEKEITKQKKHLNNQSEEITIKETILEEKDNELSRQKKINSLLFIIAILFLLGGILIYRNYLIKKKFNRLLEEKNRSIEMQSILVQSQNEELEQFNYIATHDLKAPISNLEGYYSFLKKDLKTTDEELLDTLYWIGKSIEQAKQTISDLTLVTKQETLSEPQEKINLTQLTEEILTTLNKDITSNGILVEYDFNEAEWINFGRVGLKSILQNLLSNAIKYRSTKRTPTIKISSHDSEDYVSLFVSDNGLGIDLSSQKDNLFALFKRIHTNQEGSGIGLYMIKKLIDRSGGRIEVDSEEDNGSVFKVYLRKK